MVAIVNSAIEDWSFASGVSAAAPIGRRAMSNAFDMQEGCPLAMRLFRAGEGITAAPEGVASGAFLVQMLLSSRTEAR